MGGAAALEGFAVLRHAVTLADMSIDEFESPFMSIVGLADRFENQLTGWTATDAPAVIQYDRFALNLLAAVVADGGVKRMST